MQCRWRPVRSIDPERQAMSFGSDFQAMYRRAADYVYKILRGTKSGDIQIKQPTKFDLTIKI
jgi:putative tryptophan/tyrosine transport system substrate-binding protein